MNNTEKRELAVNELVLTAKKLLGFAVNRGLNVESEYYAAAVKSIEAVEENSASDDVDAITEDQVLSQWKQYIAICGLEPTKVWKNSTGLCATIQGFTSNTNPNFTKVLQGGTIVKLSWKDTTNQSMIKGRMDFVTTDSI